MCKVANLLIQSLETGTDELRSFIAAWAALEIFVNSQFKGEYDRKWQDMLASDTPASSQIFFERLMNVMKGKYSLFDKFVVVASLLDEHSAENDIVEFKRLKGIRDNFFHGEEAQGEEGAVLPVEQVQNMLRKYLTLHLECTA